MDAPSTYNRYFAGPNALLLVALSAAAIVLVGAAVIGARNADESAAPSIVDQADQASETEDLPSYEDIAAPTVRPDGVTPSSAPVPGGAGPDATRAPVGGGGGPAKEATSAVGATRTGVFADHFEFGVHAPITIDGAPLNLAEDPITGFKGYITYVNRHGGINGRKVRLFLEDDRYTTAGGRQARDKLVNEIKPFMISGTLGVDQIAIVSKAAGERKIPYMAIGGPEPEWKTRGMFQVGSSYDQYMDLLVSWICKNGKSYVGENEVRIGTTTLDSPYILPVEKRLVQKLSSRKCVRTPVDNSARGTIRKPTEQTTYQAQLIDMRSAYGNQGVNLIVVLQDPISTSRQVAENRAYKNPTYNPRWTFSNFAHDSDTALTLMAGEWSSVRGLSGGCYYLAPNANKEQFCAKLGEARRQWNSLGNVSYDQNAGGGVGGHSSWNYNQSTWESDGSGGASGYQLVYFWHGAMKSIGADPTREKFLAALRLYNNYSNLITGPITFKGSGNIMRGASKVVALEGQSNNKYRQITPGLVDHF